MVVIDCSDIRIDYIEVQVHQPSKKIRKYSNTSNNTIDNIIMGFG